MISLGQNILTSEFLQEFTRTTSNLYRLGWDERNGGNISCLLLEEEITQYLDVKKTFRKIQMDFNAEELAGRYFIVTGSGKYFKNIAQDPEVNLGIIRITEDGHCYEVIWGFIDGAVATSELPTHLMNHIVRLKVDPNHRVILHCHATHLIAMTFTHDLDEKAITKTLWKMISECIIVFPDGVGLIPWRVPGTIKIGEETSVKMKDMQLVLWPHHGVFASGITLDEAFGLIETAEKAAEIYTIICQQGGIRQTITDRQLHELAKEFKVVPREGILQV